MRFVILAALSALLPGAAPVGAADLPVHVGHHATTPQDELVEGGKVWNYGIETWQMMKNAEGKWKIASVWWTTNLMQ
jgi:hypothetical protein